MNIYINHIGYRPADRKQAVINGPSSIENTRIDLINRNSGNIVYSGSLVNSGPVDKWKDWNFLTFDFSDFMEEGQFFLLFTADDKFIKSESFEIRENILMEKTLSDILYYFKSMRSSGNYDEQDRQIPVFGADKTIDVHGGWYDASGDTSKYLSHLSYANFLNPQQIPMVGWNLLDVLESITYTGRISGSEMEKRFIEEIFQGSDFLMRMQDESGFFYMIVFDQWSKDLDKRTLCSYSGQDGKFLDTYQAGYRQGGGIAIATLARTSSLGIKGDYDSSDYLKAATKGFDHLEKYNTQYLDDGKENIIDDYCALLAASELYKTTDDNRFYLAAEKRALNIVNRIRDDEKYSGWLCADDENRPYFHAAEAGLPVLSLIRFLECNNDSESPLKDKILTAIKKVMEFELTITTEVNNPFGYGRQYAKADDREASGTFFIPHTNPSGYWWQGENARLASLSSAASKTARLFNQDKVFSRELKSYALDQLNWIVGCNPFNMSMLQGHGLNNPVYEKDFINNPGGIANGITSGFIDERDIDFAPEGLAELGDHSWRWGEQWIPHAAWFILAVAHI